MAEAMAIGGKVLKGAGSIFGGISQSKALKKQARELDVNAGQTRAMSQREAMEERRQARLLQSKGLAIAAASGGGVDDPTLINQLADIAAEGDYRASVALYGGETEARGYEAEARARRKAGKNAKIAGFINGAASLLDAGSSMQEKYG
jgi:regulator of protease activity HflC (stomatin/prohibitin superfamily)